MSPMNKCDKGSIQCVIFECFFFLLFTERFSNLQNYPMQVLQKVNHETIHIMLFLPGSAAGPGVTHHHLKITHYGWKSIFGAIKHQC